MIDYVLSYLSATVICIINNYLLSTQAITSDVFDALHCDEVESIITVPTRVTDTLKTIIDMPNFNAQESFAGAITAIINYRMPIFSFVPNQAARLTMNELIKVYSKIDDGNLCRCRSR